jgi:hypothetical protein
MNPYPKERDANPTLQRRRARSAGACFFTIEKIGIGDTIKSGKAVIYIEIG